MKREAQCEGAGWTGGTRWLLLSIFLLLASGCGQEASVTQPELQPEGARRVIHDGGNGGSENSPSTTVTIGILGGVVRAGRHELFFPPAALLQPTSITLKDVSEREHRIQAECYPEGQQFLLPVTLTSTLTGYGNPADYTFYLVIPLFGDELLIDIGGIPTLDGTGLMTELLHFSSYAVEKRRPCCD